MFVCLLGFGGLFLEGFFYSDRAESQITAIMCQEESFLEEHPTACKRTESLSFAAVPWCWDGQSSPVPALPFQCQPCPSSASSVPPALGTKALGELPAAPAWVPQFPWDCSLLQMWLLMFVLLLVQIFILFAGISKGGIRENHLVNECFILPVCFWTHFLFTFFFFNVFLFWEKKKQNSEKISYSFISFLCATECAHTSAVRSDRFYFSTCFINRGCFLFIYF